jgi:hypothetical protein
MSKRYGEDDVRRLGLLDPTSGPLSSKAKAPVPRIETLKGKRIGLLDNSKTNAAQLLAGIGRILVERHGAAELIPRTKLIYSRVAPQDLLDELSVRCDAVLTAIGD